MKLENLPKGCDRGSEEENRRVGRSTMVKVMIEIEIPWVVVLGR